MFGWLNPFRDAQRSVRAARHDMRATSSMLEMVTLALAVRAGTHPDEMVEPEHCTISCLTCDRRVMARDMTGLEHDGHQMSISRIDCEVV
jgi:hypothetical protein